MRRSFLLIPPALCLIALAWPTRAGAEDGAVRMEWISATPADGPSWSAVLDGAGEAARSPSPLMAERWFKPLPDIDVPLIGGGSFSLYGEGLGNVLVLDFWATWCQPCQEELPHMQALYESQRERGLRVLAINVEETAAVARPYADELGLTMPLGIYDKTVKDAFLFSKLPLVIVVDRRGKMRARWDGYEQGYEKKIGEVAANFLTEKSPPSFEAATVLKGADLLRIAWMRETPGSVEGITIAGSKILASIGRSLATYEADGQTGELWNLDFIPGRLSTLAGDPEGGYSVAAYRPGSTSLFFFEMPEGTYEEWSSPSPVFDAVLLPPGEAGGGHAAVVATFDGLLHVTGSGKKVTEVEDFKGVAAVHHSADRLIALEFEGRLSWLDRSLKVSKRLQSSLDGWSLLATERDGESVGVLPVGVTASAIGEFIERDGMQVAAATRGGRLVLVDQRDGGVLFRAEWPGIEQLAAGDLDGDGLDELILAAGSKLAVLTAQSKPSAGATTEMSSRSSSSASGRAASSFSRDAQPVSTATAR